MGCDLVIFLKNQRAFKPNYSKTENKKAKGVCLLKEEVRVVIFFFIKINGLRTQFFKEKRGCGRNREVHIAFLCIFLFFS